MLSHKFKDIRQKSHNFLILPFVQQSVSESKPSEYGQLFDPHKIPSWHSSSESQSPSFSPQGIPDEQKSSSPRVG